MNSSTVYLCPGEEQPIERAVHLGRLAAFYPGCARCQHRTDSGTISAQRVGKLERFAQHSERGDSLFGPEGISGVFRNELDAAAARRVGQSFGLHLSSLPLLTGEKTDPPIVLLAGDGQTTTAELAAAAADGLRWVGCKVIDCGTATAAALLASFERLGAAGALLVGNPDGRAGHVGLTMWGQGGLPLSAGGELDQVRRIFETSSLPRASRPAGRFAPESIEGPYLSDLAEFYHALRPLRVVIETSSPVLHRYLESLVSRVAIEVAPNNAKALAATDDSQRLGRIAESIRRCGAHLGVWIDGYGERFRVVDERGSIVEPRSLLLLLAREAAVQPRGASLVASFETAWLREQLHDTSAQVIDCGPERAAHFAAMIANSAALAGDADGRIWLTGQLPTADALRVLTLLLVILSRSDRPLSKVVEADRS